MNKWTSQSHFHLLLPALTLCLLEFFLRGTALLSVHLLTKWAQNEQIIKDQEFHQHDKYRYFYMGFLNLMSITTMDCNHYMVICLTAKAYVNPSDGLLFPLKPGVSRLFPWGPTAPRDIILNNKRWMYILLFFFMYYVVTFRNSVKYGCGKLLTLTWRSKLRSPVKGLPCLAIIATS